VVVDSFLPLVCFNTRKVEELRSSGTGSFELLTTRIYSPSLYVKNDLVSEFVIDPLSQKVVMLNVCSSMWL
jgi:hypothetical protein